MSKYLKELERLFIKAAKPQNSVGMKAYMLNQFDFFGIKTPERDAIVKSFLKTKTLSSHKELSEIIFKMWSFKEREWQYAAIDVFRYHHSLWELKSIDVIESCLTKKSWWDTVDGIGSNWIPNYFSLYPDQIISVTGKWNQSENIWLQRSSILFQRSYKSKTNTRLLKKYILNHKDAKEFFVQKAIGWALREYSKTDPDWVINFVAKNKIAPLSKREAIKRIIASN